MRGTGRMKIAHGLLRPLARAVDGIAHNGQRRRTIQRYRRVECVTLARGIHDRQRFLIEQKPPEA